MVWLTVNRYVKKNSFVVQRSKYCLPRVMRSFLEARGAREREGRRAPLIFLYANPKIPCNLFSFMLVQRNGFVLSFLLFRTINIVVRRSGSE